MKKIIFPLLLISLLVPLFSFAHGSLTVGRVDHDGYIILLDAYEKLEAGRAERLNFELEKKSTTTGETSEVHYTDVWMRITGPSDEVLFTGNIVRAPEGLVTGFSYQYPTSGTYEVAVRFLDGDRIMTETSFHFKIAPSMKPKNLTQQEWLLIVVALILGIFIGFIGMLLKAKYNKA